MYLSTCQMYLRTYVKIWTCSEVSMVALTQVITLYFFVQFESEIFRLSVISLFKIGLHTRDSHELPR